MTTLRQADEEVRSSARQTLNSIWSEIQDVNSSYARSYLIWCLRKLQINKAHQKESGIRREIKNERSIARREILTVELNQVKHKNHPRNICKGDIVHVKFGVNVGNEMSDLDANSELKQGHYAVVLGQKGFMFLIAPLTSHEQPEPTLQFANLHLPGETTISYLSLGKIKSVHIRRIERILGIPEGKRRLDPDDMVKLDEVVAAYLGMK
ncbi:MAG: hypothetical protein ACXVP2_12245 [Tumebacillaceae bacterium]